jgi:hypothetical protein
MVGLPLDSLPPAWREAFAREQLPGKPLLADPLPERRVARLLAAFITTGLVFLVLPGTLLGVWNLLTISAGRQADATSTAWIQAHGHAQLFGWVTSFMLGICLYAFPKFRGRSLRSLAVGWLMFAMWTIAVASRWFSAVASWHWQLLWPTSASLELVVAFLLVWQSTASGTSRHKRELWELQIFAGFYGLIATLMVQLVLLWQTLPAPVIPHEPDQLFIGIALWIFCFPVVWGFSGRLLPTFLGLKQSGVASAYAGLGMLAAAAILMAADRSQWAAALILGAVASACWSLRIFHSPERPAKVAGVDPLYPRFIRVAFVWLVISSLLAFDATSPGLTGASRHAFTVGFLATMIFAIGPRILPAFLNSRELWSQQLMRWSLVLLTTGCTLRVVSEPLAYAGVAFWAWRTLPVSAFIELSAVLLFALNVGKTLATPIPTWFGREQIKGTMMLYWYVSSYPATRQLLIEAGLATLQRVRSVPKTLTLADAAAADGADLSNVIKKLGDFFDARRTRTSRANG